MSLYSLDDPGDLVAPTLVAAFDGWVDAGTAATTALGHLADDAAVVATFDADRLFDYRARRPPLEIVDGRLTELTWHELVLRRTRSPSATCSSSSGRNPTIAGERSARPSSS